MSEYLISKILNCHTYNKENVNQSIYSLKKNFNDDNQIFKK